MCRIDEETELTKSCITVVEGGSEMGTVPGAVLRAGVESCVGVEESGVILVTCGGGRGIKGSGNGSLKRRGMRRLSRRWRRCAIGIPSSFSMPSDDGGGGCCATLCSDQSPVRGHEKKKT